MLSLTTKTAIAALALVLVPALACAEDLARVVGRSMRGLAGTALVADVATGRLIASHRVDLAARRLVPPGSTIKPFTLLAYRQSGAELPALVCDGKLRLGGRQMDCAHPRSPVPLDAVTALAYSCNSYFARLGLRIRPEAWPATIARFGFTALTGLARDEVPGTLLSATTPEQRQLQALGEYGVMSTPLGMLTAYRRLAMAGDPVIREGLQAAAVYGTARLAGVTGMAVAGKTGTAASHAWFAGFAPADAPRYVVVVFLEQGTGGSSAAPVAHEIFEGLPKLAFRGAK